MAGVAPSRAAIGEGRGVQGPVHVAPTAAVGVGAPAMALTRRSVKDLPGVEGATVTPGPLAVGLAGEVGPSALIAGAGPAGPVRLLAP